MEAITRLHSGKVLAGSGLEPRHTDVILQGGRIAEVGSDRTNAASARFVDATDLTLLPGFIDAHVHIGLHRPAEVLHGGVTTVRDLAWPPGDIFPLAERSRAPDFEGPEILAAGPMLTVPGGYPTRASWAPPNTGLAIRTPADGTEIVDRLARIGVAVVKVALDPTVGPTFDGATLGAIVDAARARGLKTTAHVHGLEQLLKALDAGIDELAHMLLGRERIPDKTIDRMVAAGMTIVPTLAIRDGKEGRAAVENLARFRAARGRVVYGTDLGNEGTQPGIDPREVQGMTKAGFDGAEIIRSATVDSAAWLGMPDRGVIAEGARADIVGVAGDPLRDPKALLDVKLVVRAGRVIRER